MAMNSIQNLGESQYLNQQAAKLLQSEQVAVEQQNQKAAETDLNRQAANRVQEAFKLNISKEGETMLKASEQVNEESIAPESPKPLQNSYSAPEQQASQIVNIIA